MPSLEYALHDAGAQPGQRTTSATVRRMKLDRLASAMLVLLALSLGLGDIAQVTPLDSILLAGVHALLPLTMGLALLSALVDHRWPHFPRRVVLPLAAWLVVLLLSAALASTNAAEALSALERPAAGALLALSTCAVCTTHSRWLLRARRRAASVRARLRRAGAAGRARLCRDHRARARPPPHRRAQCQHPAAGGEQYSAVAVRVLAGRPGHAARQPLAGRRPGQLPLAGRRLLQPR